MTNQEFDQLPLHTKISYACAGIFVETVSYYGYRVVLYAVERDFYEVFYEPSANRIENVVMCSDGDLRKYLPEIK